MMQDVLSNSKFPGRRAAAVSMIGGANEQFPRVNKSVVSY
jgi:hypothetical protein